MINYRQATNSKTYNISFPNSQSDPKSDPKAMAKWDVNVPFYCHRKMIHVQNIWNKKSQSMYATHSRSLSRSSFAVFTVLNDALETFKTQYQIKFS